MLYIHNYAQKYTYTHGPVASWAESKSVEWKTEIQSPGRVIRKTQEMAVDASLLNIQRYIKDQG